jgi:hypothetical protein
VLTPDIPTDLPTPRSFEETLAGLSGTWRRTNVGRAAVFHDFAPPFSPEVEAWPGAGAASDRDLATAVNSDPMAPTTLTLDAPRPLRGVSFLAGTSGPRLLRNMDVEVSADGLRFDRVTSRRRREERLDLRWVNGHPQAVLDHDLLAVPLGGRPVQAVRIVPVESNEPWGLGEVLLHPASADAGPWDEWLDPNLSWPARAQALRQKPLPSREDWYYRLLLATRVETMGREPGGPP